MITFEKFELENGLKVIVHQDKSTPIVAFNLLYDVGARDEDENKTGFAHLFEHLMFGGSINVPNFDEPLQKVGGDNNAFTSNDITNYYITLPKENLETAFWLESDRMLSLAFTDKSLEVQRQVVIEEFKQNYLNQPYGDVWLLLRPLAYSKHPYKWATIGKEIAHIENATMEDVKDFFFHHYLPNNAILCIAGNIRTEEIKTLTQKWFGEILKGNVKERNLTVEPKQTKERRLQVERDVPSNAIYKAYKMCKRSDNDYFATDLLSDILSMGNSSRLYTSLIKEQKLFSDINAYVMGSIDEGLFIISGHLSDNVSFEEAEKGIINELEKIKSQIISENELQKVKNKLESSREFSESNVLNKAMNLCFAELLGDANLINTESECYDKVSTKDIHRIANQILVPTNCSTLIYAKKIMNILDRKVAPKFNSIGSIDFIAPLKKELDNKVPVHIISGGSQEILKIDFIFQAGIWHQKSPLIARATNSLIKEGTKKYSSAEIANGIDQYGAYLQTDCDYDRASITVFTLSKYLEKILPFIKEVLTQPVFDTKEFDIYKQNAFQKHKINLEKVSYIARNEFMKQLFGDENAYGRMASENDFQTLDNNNIIEFYNSFYNLGNCKIIVSGNVNDAIISTLNSWLGDIKTKTISLEQSISEIPHLQPQKIYKEKEKALQSAIRIGKVMPTKTHPDYFKLQILNTVLGGYFGSRLMKNIREDKGYTYGIGSGILSLQNVGYFYISTEVGADVTNNALDEIYKELKKLNTELIPQEELNLVKNYLLGNFLKACDGPFKMAALFENVHFYGYDFNFYNCYIDAIKNVSANELLEIANKYLTIDGLTEIVAGKMN